MPLGTEVGIDPGDIVLDRDPAPPTFPAYVYCGQMVAHLSYRCAHVYCDQMVGWIKMKLGTEVASAQC